VDLLNCPDPPCGIRGQDIAMIFWGPMTALNRFSVGNQIARFCSLSNSRRHKTECDQVAGRVLGFRNLSGGR
jgi:ABC-type microcin C transport system duplicated ATPase subunit YejF